MLHASSIRVRDSPQQAERKTHTSRLEAPFSTELNKGDSDSALATFSRERNFVIVTYDDDFRDEFSDDEYYAVLYLPDQTLSAKTIANALHEISTYYQQSDLQGFMTIGKTWL